ncbi:hypothetical protein VE01_06965 [Pseudogymnoascus verrucosus]|uniref:Rhodopsin domain-containing protein n=1 Tax=Pseudogymnoascus verrucosus TaxID=342668 RepID=A0A1B8GE90_9PEZI|nr:uncharacterized protein VE01_06965 [Pseudogymnoascus verrucosus]OBT94144.1 hypothetical protein VE01_06965 [Pseudogymnoascus verrucosus]
MAPSNLTRYEELPVHADNDLGPYLNRSIWILAVLAGTLLGLRLYSKLYRHRSLWWDDYILIAAWVALVASTSLQSAGIKFGLGKHYEDMQDKEKVSLFSYAAGFFSILATVWSKTSFAVTLLRVSNGWMKWLVWFIIVSTNLVLGANAIIQWIQCWPVEKLWHTWIKGRCWSYEIIQDYNIFVAAFSGFVDILLALLPWKIISPIVTNKRETIGVLIAMSMGVIAGIVSFLKIRTITSIGDENTTNVSLFIFGTAEGATSIMAASIPVLRALIKTNTRPQDYQDHDRPASTRVMFRSSTLSVELESRHNYEVDCSK